MKGPVRNWLPLEAAIGPRVRDALEGAVDAWSGKWFSGTRAALARVEPHDRNAQGAWLWHGGAVALPSDGAETVRIAGLALGADPENLVLSEPDRDIVGKLAATILADLATTLLAATGRSPADGTAPSPIAPPLAGEAGITLHIADAGARPLTRAFMPLSLLVPFIKAGIPARPGPALPRLDGAIGRTAARLDIRFGETRLSLGDLAGLATGDVLVLDRTIDAGLSISLSAGEKASFACAALDSGDGTTRLILNQEQERFDGQPHTPRR